ncbi:MAG: hypothetical protein AABY83_05730 [Pseudomonadota bacterium]
MSAPTNAPRLASGGFSVIYSATSQDAHYHLIKRRDTTLGWIALQNPPPAPELATAKTRWQSADSVLLPQLLSVGLARYAAHFVAAQAFYEAVLSGRECADLLAAPPYFERYRHAFDILSSSYDAADGQQIERIDFDAIKNQHVVAEELWMKASWLSYVEEDASLRFRFSFGMDGYEDVGADFTREMHAAALAEHVFPESALIASNARLLDSLRQITGEPHLAFIERIIYFNAPNGGAQFHQDVEGVHLGIVFAQLTGRTAWLSLPKNRLVDEICRFLQNPAANKLMTRAKIKPAWRNALLSAALVPETISAQLDSPEHAGLEKLINNVPEFFAQLVDHGYANILNPGDVLLLPQHNMQHCTWHSVFCLDEHAGEALSFAVRAVP